jgi:hypothetical protein
MGEKKKEREIEEKRERENEKGREKERKRVRERKRENNGIVRFFYFLRLLPSSSV